MHDPMVVAFEIRRPWPKRRSKKTGHRYWPALVTVWHREPGGHDSGEVCKHYQRRQDSDGQWHVWITHGWRWHVWHWRIQVPPLQDLRRRMLTRCAWCGDRSHKGDPVNISHQWDGPRSRWWQGEPGLFHHDCSSVEYAHRKCFCEVPVLNHGDYGQCQRCGKFRAWHDVLDDADWLLRRLPAGSRIPAELRPELEAAWARRRAAKESA